MPTVKHINNLRVVIYPNDHRPAHVHVIGPGGEAIFILNCPGGPPELREVYDFSLRDVHQIKQQIAKELVDLCKIWKDIHDDY